MDPDSSFISKLESDLYKSIEEIRNDRPPLEIRRDLYDVALHHAQNCVNRVHKNVKEGYESRRNLFRDAKRYIEINFVTKSLDIQDPIPFISNILRDHYVTRIQSQINSIGPAVLRLKSNKYVVIILGAFFSPKFSIRQFFEFFPKIRDMSEPSTDFETLFALINHFRESHNYKPLFPGNSTKHGSSKKILSKEVSYESKKASDLFCRLFTDQTFIDLIGDIWTDFSYSVKKGESNSLITLRFYRDEEEYVYTVDVQHPIVKNQFAKENLLNGDVKDNNFRREQNQDSIITAAVKKKRSPFEKFEPSGSKVSLKELNLSPYDKPQALFEYENRNNSQDSSNQNSEQEIIVKNHKPLISKLVKKSAWGNLKPKNLGLQTSQKLTEDEEKQKQEEETKNESEEQKEQNESDERNEQNESDERNEDDILILPQKDTQSQDEFFESDSSEVFKIHPKTRSNSTIISARDIQKSPWLSVSMKPSDKQFSDKRELLRIPSDLRRAQSKHPTIPPPSKMIAHPFTAQSSIKGFNKIKDALSQSDSSKIDSINEIEQPQKKKIEHASNAWALINPDLSQKEQNGIDEDEINPDTNELQLSPISNKNDKNADDNVNVSPLGNKNNDPWSNLEQSTDSTIESDVIRDLSSEKIDNDNDNQSSEKIDDIHDLQSPEKSDESNKKKISLKKSHKAVISPLGQSLKKTGLKTLKKKQPIKSIPSSDKSTFILSPSQNKSPQ